MSSLTYFAVEQNNHKAAFDHFTLALDVARAEEDKDAVAAVEKAIIEIQERLKTAATDDQDTRQPTDGEATGATC